MRPVSPWARVYVVCTALGAACCALPLPATHAPWGAVLLFAALCAGCEGLAGSRFGAGRTPEGAGVAGEPGGSPRWHTPVILAAAFLLPPPAAALVALPGALLTRVEQRPRWLRRVWRAGQLALAAWAASWVHWAMDGRDAVLSSHFPYVLVTAGAAVVAFCLVLTVLDGGILVLAERVPVRSAWRGLFLRSLAPVAVHGLAGLMMAVLWRSPYGPVSALLVLLPMYVSWWVFAQYHRERAAHQATIRALVQAVDIKDGYTRGHSERVGQASMVIARELGMDDERAEVLRFAGILHDVGKLGVPTRLLRKDGPLTPEERRVIELHPEYGHEMVRGIGFFSGGGQVGDPAPPRAAGRERVSVRAQGGPDSGVRAGGGGRGRLRRDDVHPVVPAGAACCGRAGGVGAVCGGAVRSADGGGAGAGACPQGVASRRDGRRDAAARRSLPTRSARFQHTR
ncbi:hypothetical protein QF035_003821 [Streptomyces umbrinus]|uniref:HD-GYP domain-containing protein n=1 Tax=Streptomyces umbrinus TaxID=67370 RepID=A0ABU0SRQ8_9ACTN|nr:hypothetical protein [Streptomyces umbrinus]